ncbi:putative radical SAM protein YgiQ [Paraperlucidibaca baekdonensis]|uniref:Putative radical SAM protein YgiQ n=1 Tax=Paraperlucidibaca baekdonensis TaxID=748120 RepID=A0A3E0H8T7_9GAMM|nr:YgiQ family radical SAM protein [Paraperlucidibaca baekdonensis]REH40043.1 putative radical SAM protein YgiQ [Paraperlucidibaca baekdonensis]
MSLLPPVAKTPLFGYDRYWAECFGPAPFLPMSRAEMDQLGWDSCDIIIVTGDAYVDHPSFGMAIIGRLLEAQGFRVGIIAQPDWQSADPFKILGKPNLFFGIAAGNMDSMINRYTADRKIRSDDAYSPNDEGGRRPDRASLVYAQRAREAYSDVPQVLGGIEASLRRIAHYDYWQDKVRRSILLDAKSDILLYGNAERAIVEIAHRLSRGENIRDITDIRGTVFLRRDTPAGMFVLDSSRVDAPGRVDRILNPYVNTADLAACDIEKQKGAATYAGSAFSSELSDAASERGFGTFSGNSMPGANDIGAPIKVTPGAWGELGALPEDTTLVELLPSGSDSKRSKLPARDDTVIRLPSYEKVKADPVLYAHANRVLHLETNPGNARALVQRHGENDVWLNPPPIPLTTEEMDYVFDLPYARVPHPAYGGARIPAYEMIRFSVNIMRGCFGGCTFCSITEHEGRIIQNRSEDSIIREVEKMREVPGFTGIVSDLGGPTANMYRLACKSPAIEAACRKPSCVYPGICENLNTDHDPLIKLYRRARELKGVKKILIGSGLRYDLAVQSPEYVRELVTHHVGGYLKIAPEHTEGGPLSKMMKPGIGSYDRFKQLFDKFSKEAGKEQFLIPYFIAAHPGTTDEDMMNLAMWLKKNGYRADQVQTFYPSPMATATAMYHSGKNPLRKVMRDSEAVDVVKGDKRRRLHKAFLRYHDANNWPLLREALTAMGRADLIGNSKQHLIPTWQPATDGQYASPRKKNGSAGDGVSLKVQKTGGSAQRPARVPRKGQIQTQHTGLPPRDDGSRPARRPQRSR